MSNADFTDVIQSWLDQLWRHHGTDLHLTAGTPPLIRLNGELVPISGQPPLTADQVRELVLSLLTKDQREQLAAGADVDFSLSWHDTARLRGNVFRQRDSYAVALRMMPHRIPTFDELKLPSAVRDLANLRQGLVLLGGPTGSGKSTTLAAIVDWINTNRAVHVLTIEDPIEYLHTYKRAAINQRAVGLDTESFAAALKSALREDPDVIVVGEMRDLESIRFTLTLAETGHLVFASLHTNDTSQTINRLIDVFPADQQPQVRVQLSTALTAVAHQRLLPRRGGGQVAAFEVMLANPPIRNLLAQGKAGQLRNQLLSFQRDGMRTLEVSLSELVAEGLVDYAEAVACSQYPRDVRPPPSGAAR